MPQGINFELQSVGETYGQMYKNGTNPDGVE